MDPKDNRSEPGRGDRERTFHPIEVRVTLQLRQRFPTPHWELAARCNHEPLDQQQGRLGEMTANSLLEALKGSRDVGQTLAWLCAGLTRLQDLTPEIGRSPIELLRVELVMGVGGKVLQRPPASSKSALWHS